jgi:TRAP-type uncharacterized transport system substrate-binding protein
MKGRYVLRWTAVLLGLAALGLLAWLAAHQPRTFKIAVGPDGSQQMIFMRSLARAMVETRQPYRLEIVPKPDSIRAAMALDANDVDLAVLRSDDTTSADARSIVTIQKRHVLVIARQDSGFTDISSLIGRPIGVVRGGSDDNRNLIRRILQHYATEDVDAGGLELRDLPIQQASAALAAGEVDALVFVAWPGQRLRRIVADVAERQKIPLIYAGVPAPEALAFRYRDMEASELPAGVFGGSPPRPPNALATVAISYEIVASEDMATSRATDLASALLDARTHLRRIDDNSFVIETPPIDVQRRYMPHAGVVALVNDDSKTFLETYSDHIWLTLFGLSILGSSITGFLAWAGLREALPSQNVGMKLARLVERLDATVTLAEVDAVEAEFLAMVKTMFLVYAKGGIDLSEDDPSPWIALFSNMVDKRRAALRCAADG